MLSELSVVVPCFKSGRELEALVEQLLPELKVLSERFEIILVDDGSPDDTWRSIKELTLRFPFLRGLRLATNLGQHGATYVGLKEAAYSLVLTMDDDLQNPPTQIKKLIVTATEKTELGVVYGIPLAKNHANLRKVGSTGFRILLKWLGLPTADYVSSFRLIKREQITNWNAFSMKNPFLDVLFILNKMQCSFVKVEHHERASGASTYTYARLAKLALTCWQASLAPKKQENVTDTYTITEQCSSVQPLIC